MANYPFRINIVTADGHQTAYYTSSIVTDADTIVSSSAMLDKILLMPSASFETAASGSTDGQLGESNYNPLKVFSNYGSTGHINYHLSASVTGPHTGSIIFHDRERTQNGGLDYYEFYGSKVCSVLGLPEGIRIRPENFKFSDDVSNPGNYMSGDLISDSVQLKEGFKMAPQARMRSNLVWDDVFGEGFVQWVSGSTRKAFIGYDDQRDLYSLAISQITGSTVKATTFTGALFGNATSATTATNLNGGTVTLGLTQSGPDSPGYVSKILGATSATGLDGNGVPEANFPIVISGSYNDVGHGGDIILQGGHNERILTSQDVRGGNITIRPGTAAIVGNFSTGNPIDGKFVVSGSSDFTGDLDVGGTYTNNTQPAFLALNSSTDSNLAINANIKIEFNDEVYDQANNYDNGTDTFTAPVTGKYLLSTTVRLDQIDTAAAWVSIRIVTSNNEYRRFIDPNFSADLNQFALSMTTIADMDANDTAHVEFKQSGGTNQVDVNSGNPGFSPPQLDTFFSGYLLG